LRTRPTRALTYTSDADVAAGAAAGVGVGGALGLLATSAMRVVPGLGPVVGTGALLAALATGTAIGGVAGGLAGGVYGALRELGMGESDAQRFERGVQAGLTLVSVHTAALSTAEIQAELTKYNASDILVGVLPDPDPRSMVLADEEDTAVVGRESTDLAEPAKRSTFTS
jgi:hypothetical protein